MIEAYERTHKAKEVTKYYGVDESTVYRLERQKKQVLICWIAIGGNSEDNEMPDTKG